MIAENQPRKGMRRLGAIAVSPMWLTNPIADLGGVALGDDSGAANETGHSPPLNGEGPPSRLPKRFTRRRDESPCVFLGHGVRHFGGRTGNRLIPGQCYDGGNICRLEGAKPQICGINRAAIPTLGLIPATPVRIGSRH